MEMKGYALMKIPKDDTFEVMADQTMYSQFEDHQSEKYLYINQGSNENIYLVELNLNDFVSNSGGVIQYSKLKIPYRLRRILFKSAVQAKRGAKIEPLKIDIQSPLLVLNCSLPKTPNSSPVKSSKVTLMMN